MHSNIASKTIAGKRTTRKPIDELLTPEQEKELARLIQSGATANQKLTQTKLTSIEREALNEQVTAGLQARDLLMIRNQGLVGKVARRYFDTDLQFEDLMQEGQIGLLKAAERYDPEHGTRFSTYAVWWIRQTIGRAIANTGRAVRLPVNLGQRVMQVRRTEIELEQQFGRNATIAEVAAELNWPLPQVRHVHEAVVQVTPLEKIVGNGDNADTELQELLPDESIQRPDEEAERHLLSQEIEAALNALPEWEAKILQLRYGFADGKPLSLSELARQFGLSREGMRQITNRALLRLRRSASAKGLQEYT
jgi:RNA polymerase sigma factor (sigma-70 family)